MSINTNPSNKTKKAVIYCRVSTKEQVDEGNSLVTQEKICKEYARKHCFEVSVVFIEEGESAKNTDRKKLQEMLLFCANKRNDVSAVIVYKLDRLSRNTDDYSQIRILLKKYGVEIKSTTEFFENNPAGKFIENMLANVAQFDNDVRAERCAGGMKDAMREGRYVWMASVGYENTKVNGKATICPSKMAPFVKKVFEEVALGIDSLEAIRIRAEKEGLRLKNGKPLGKAYFYKLLRNKVYAGYIEKFGEIHKGTFDPIISVELFDQVQRNLRKGKKITQYKTDNPDFPLRRFVFDKKTQKKLTGSWSSGNGGKYPFYRYPSIKGQNFRKDDLESRFMEYLDSFALHIESSDRLLKVIEDRWKQKVHDMNNERKGILRKIQDLEDKQEYLLEANRKQRIDDNLFVKQMTKISEEIEELRARIYEEELSFPKLEGATQFVRTFLSSPSSVWMEADLDTKTKLQWFQFPSGIIFDGKKFETNELACIFKTKDAITASLSIGVDPRRFELLTSGVQNRRSTK
jgi:site-specific DNA recombinase